MSTGRYTTLINTSLGRTQNSYISNCFLYVIQYFEDIDTKHFVIPIAKPYTIAKTFKNGSFVDYIRFNIGFSAIGSF